MQKRCQWLIAAKSHDINGLCLQNRGNGGFKGRRIQIVYGILDLFDICAEYGGQDLRLGASAVLVNTAIAVAGNPVEMAKAFKAATEAGRQAYEAGLGLQADNFIAEASSPLTAFLDK